MTKVRTIVLGGACALALAAGCDNGGGAATDAGSGTDTGPRVDTGVPPTDTGTPAEDTGTPTPDAGMTNGCELGNTFPDLDLAPLHTFGGGEIPVGFALAPGRDDLFVVLQHGTVAIVDPVSGDVTGTFIDVTDRLGGTPGEGDEWGLLGLAFHPDYATNGLVYLAYTALTGARTTNCYGQNVAAYEDRLAVAMRTGSDAAVFEADLFVIPDPAGNHNGGQLGFGPDGYLYYGVGDGGEQDDPCHRAQDPTNPLGKIHRFEVGPGIATYNPAPGNPFLGGGGLPTIWAYGLRNPWRFGWDRLTDDFYVGDVGQNEWEEVDFLPAGAPAGANFGWSICEGTHDHGGGSCAGLAGAVAPLTEYSHHAQGVFDTSGSGSVTGGYVYRGAAIPGLRGAYVYADEIISDFAALRNCPGLPVTPTPISFATGYCPNPTSFGEDRNGELLVGCYLSQRIYRIVAAP